MIILFGGTFDPIHLGHMKIAEKLYEVFKHPITFLPTGIPTYKAQPQVSAQDRLAMIRLALDNDNRFCIDDNEIKRDEFCYTYKTLTRLREKIGYHTPVFFIIGSDSLVTLDTWDNWENLFDLTNFVVIMRPRYNQELMSKNLQEEFSKRHETDIKTFINCNYGKIYIVDFDPIDISSTKIRQNIKYNLSINNLVSPEIANYIKEHRLYT
ncbi:MAG: nicotinate-nucleotide adenylyltransferase [Neisseriaceae bacterium]